MRTVPGSTAPSRPGRALMAALVVGTIGWVGILWIAAQLASGTGSNLGFDLEILAKAGRESAAGRSPYDPALIAGGAPMATSLFYSYPPPVAQAFSLLSTVPSRAILLAWDLGAVGGLLVVTELLRRRLAPERSRREVLLVAAACVPLALPFAVGLLFGNLDVWFPFLYGAMLLAALAPGRGTAIGAGAALAAASLKLHPASLGAWFLVRALGERADRRQGSAGRVAVSAIVVVAAVIALSLVVGGVGVWAGYADVVRAGAGATIVDPRNASIAAQIVAITGGGDDLARSLHVIVGIVAVLITIWAAWKRPDPVESFAWATAASLATLPVTWYHYPSAMIPIAVAALLRGSSRDTRRVALLVTAGAVVAAVALVWLPLLWVGIGLVIAAARTSGSAPASAAVATAAVPARAAG